MNEAYVSSQRTTVLQTLVSEFKKVSQQRYFVRRGPINWADFNFDQHPFAVMITCDETSLIRHDPQVMVVSIEMGMKMPASAGEQLIDDSGLDKLFEDVSIVLAELESKMEQGLMPGDQDNVILALNRETDKVVEWSDSAQGIQGIWAAFMIEY